MRKESLFHVLFGKNTETLIVTFLTIVPIVYFWFRYPFKIAVDIPFTGYTETPFSLKIGKYLILTIIGTFLFFKIYNRKILTKRYAPLAVLSILSLSALVAGTLSNDIHIIKFSFSLTIPVLLASIDFKKIELKNVNTMLLLTLALLLVSNLLIALNYLYFDRLPAHSYPIDILLQARFGSLLEDPNSFGLLLVFFFYQINHQSNQKSDWIILIAILLCMALSQSLTTLIAFFASGLAYILINWKRLLPKTGILFLLLIVAIIVISYSPLADSIKPAIIDLYLQKEESLKLHMLDIFQTTADEPEQSGVGESGIRNITNKLGVLFFLLLTSFITYYLLITLKRITQQGISQSPSIIVASTFFLIGVSVACIGLPIENMFSVSTFFGLALGLLISYSYSGTDRSPSPTIK